jgi:uncharacterized protein YbjT (DUF2867 family)
MSKTGLVIGASGLVGQELVRILLDDPEFSLIKIFVRKKLNTEHKKLEQIITDFNDLKKVEDKIIGDVVFCAMGTTIKTAGSKEEFAKVDYTYVLSFADIAKKNNVPQFIAVSSLGVSEGPVNFYLSVKRDMETELKRLKFHSLIIVRPSMLLGKRSEFRLGELIGKVMMKTLSFVFIGKLRKYKAIEARTVAKAMIALSKAGIDGNSVFESDRLQQLGK